MHSLVNKINNTIKPVRIRTNHSRDLAYAVLHPGSAGEAEGFSEDCTCQLEYRERVYVVGERREGMNGPLPLAKS